VVGATKRHLKTVYGVKGHEALSVWTDGVGSMTVWTGLKVDGRPVGQVPLTPESARELAETYGEYADIAETGVEGTNNPL